MCHIAIVYDMKKKVQDLTMTRNAESEGEPRKQAENGSPLRTEQRELVKKFILEAVAEEINSGKGDGISMAEVAERARISLRTLYRHYPTKEALMESFWTQYVGQILSLTDDPLPPERLGAWAKDTFASFETHREMFKALLTTGPGRDVRAATMHRRRRMITGSLETVTARLDPESAKRIHALIHVLVSVGAWQGMSDNWGLHGKESGSAVAWAVDLILREITANPDSLKNYLSGKETP
jgi:AcrR family transcriptional regulator